MIGGTGRKIVKKARNKIMIGGDDAGESGEEFTIGGGVLKVVAIGGETSRDGVL